eukprot:882192-Pyramimonas_sp.AAC.1
MQTLRQPQQTANKPLPPSKQASRARQKPAAAPTAPAADGMSAITAAMALKQYVNELSEFEQSEILEYQQVYFVGPAANKVRASCGYRPRGCGYRPHGCGYRPHGCGYRIAPTAARPTTALTTSAATTSLSCTTICASGLRSCRSSGRAASG